MRPCRAPLPRQILVAAFIAALLPMLAPRSLAEEGALTPDSEAGFRRFMAMAATGKLGTDVHAANVTISRDGLRIELLRRDMATKVLKLTAKRSRQEYCRYFDIAAGEAADPDDVIRVGKALDDAFSSNPFSLTGVEQPPDFEPPGWLESWRSDGWRGTARAAELRMMTMASRSYTVAITAAVALFSLAGTALLWLSDPAEIAGQRNP